MGVIHEGNGRVKCDKCNGESGSNETRDCAVPAFKTTIHYDNNGFEIYKRTVCSVCTDFFTDEDDD